MFNQFKACDYIPVSVLEVSDNFQWLQMQSDRVIYTYLTELSTPSLTLPDHMPDPLQTDAYQFEITSTM